MQRAVFSSVGLSFCTLTDSEGGGGGSASEQRSALRRLATGEAPSFRNFWLVPKQATPCREQRDGSAVGHPGAHVKA